MSIISFPQLFSNSYLIPMLISTYFHLNNTLISPFSMAQLFITDLKSSVWIGQRSPIKRYMHLWWKTLRNKRVQFRKKNDTLSRSWPDFSYVLCHSEHCTFYVHTHTHRVFKIFNSSRSCNKRFFICHQNKRGVIWFLSLKNLRNTH